MLLKVFNDIVTAECILRLTGSWRAVLADLAVCLLFAFDKFTTGQALLLDCPVTAVLLLSWYSCCQHSFVLRMLWEWRWKSSWNLNAGWMSLKAAGLSFPALFLPNVFLLSCSSSLLSGPAVVDTGAPRLTAPTTENSLEAQILRHEYFPRLISLHCFNSDVNFFSQFSLNKCVCANQKVWIAAVSSLSLEEC